jgi:protein gp37
MGKETAISWCRHTFNAWIGCTHVSPACEFCYAEAWANRFGQVGWGARADRKRTSAENWKQPLKWDKAAREAGEVHTVFCNSLSDVFDDHPSIQLQWRHDLWVLIDSTPNLHWLPLTKRPENWLRFLPYHVSQYRNMTLGVTIEDVRRCHEAVPHIYDVVEVGWKPPFISYEPALEAVDWEPLLKHRMVSCIIAGGGSGQDKRPIHPDNYRRTRDACAKWGVGFHFKQWGNWASVSEVEGKGEHFKFPDGATVRWIGDRGKTERTLDGRTHNDMPGDRKGTNP